MKLVSGPSWSAGWAVSHRPAKNLTRSRSSFGVQLISHRRFVSPFFQLGGSSHSMKLEKGISAPALIELAEGGGSVDGL